MIYTVTLNPSIDRVMDVEELIYDDVNRIVEERSKAGGKGIDVSRGIKGLGGQSVALGFIGGYKGMELEGELIDEGVVCDFTSIGDSTRTNIIIYQRKKKLQTLLSTAAPEVRSHEMVALFNKIKEIPKGSFVVISGSMPRGVNESFCAQLVTTLKEKGVKVVIDADEDVLRRAVDAGPYLMKPNIHEFGRLVERNLSEVEEVVEHAKPYGEQMAYVVVSMGPKGAVGICSEGIFHMIPPKVKVRSSVGAGDSLVAGVVYTLNNGGSFEEALKLGVACGTASTLNPGTNLYTREDVQLIEKEIIVKKF
jgi:6-phosphofructokinase 2